MESLTEWVINKKVIVIASFHYYFHIVEPAHCYRKLTLFLLHILPQGQKSWQCRLPIMMIPKQTTYGSSTAWSGKFQRVLVPFSEWTGTRVSFLSRQTVWRVQHLNTPWLSLQRMLKVIIKDAFIYFWCCFLSPPLCHTRVCIYVHI